LVVASSLMYFAEHAAQPEAFPSIPGTMWWGVVTLTTVGYGDVTPITPAGQLIGSVVAILGIGLFALPASIMASGFIEGSSYETGFCPDCGHELDWQADVGGSGPVYAVGDRIRIDITRESALAYEYHGSPRCCYRTRHRQRHVRSRTRRQRGDDYGDMARSSKPAWPPGVNAGSCRSVAG